VNYNITEESREEEKKGYSASKNQELREFVSSLVLKIVLNQSVYLVW